MALFQIWADARNPGSDKILPDIGFETLPHYMNDFMITDIYVYGWLLITLWRLYYTGNFELALRRFFWISGTLYIIRGFTITFTVLPTPYTGCQPRIHEIPLLAAVKIVFGNLSTCGDVLYSGHTMMLTSSALIWQIYDRRKLFTFLAWTVSIIGMLIIISTHFHYSDDVIIAFIFTTFIHLVYFLSLRTNYCEERLSLLECQQFPDVIHSPRANFSFVTKLIAVLDGCHTWENLETFSVPDLASKGERGGEEEEDVRTINRKQLPMSNNPTYAISSGIIQSVYPAINSRIPTIQ